MCWKKCEMIDEFIIAKNKESIYNIITPQKTNSSSHIEPCYNYIQSDIHINDYLQPNLYYLRPQ